MTLMEILLFMVNADSIMLALKSHKSYIYLLREALEFGQVIENKFHV